MRTDELDFDLPPELIAQQPPPERAASRLLHYRRDDRSIAHRTFSDLPRLLRPGDLLVFNDAKVMPARFMMRKVTGGRIEGLFLREVRPGRWLVLLKNLGLRRNLGTTESQDWQAAPAPLLPSPTPLRFEAAPDVSASPVRIGEGGEYEIDVDTTEPPAAFLERVGRMPLPPYIRRDKDHDARDADDRVRYQTVYARAPGSVAAPTAGLHFTPQVLADLNSAGVEHTFITLHVGLGTFRPVSADTLDAHAMHAEAYEIGPAAADALNRARSAGRRVVAVGTTSARVLESHPAGVPWQPATAQTSIFIRPPYRWNHIGALVTNFHLPRSTLIALVAAWVGLDEQRRIYAEAVGQRYRFFSYGDAMLAE